MLQRVDLGKVLFLDIETVSQQASFQDLSEKTQALWEKKARFLTKEDETAEEVYGKAGIYAEFGKIVCISVGFVREQYGEKHIRVKSFYGDDEKDLLTEFSSLLNSHYNSPYHILCGHNAKEFDFPYIARRMVIHQLDLPFALQIAGKKPWEIPHLDTMELWKFGDYKHFTSLELLAHVFDIPTPKDDIDGSQVGAVYWQDNDLERIKNYCEKDVVTLIRLFMKYRGEEMIPDDLIEGLSF